MLCRLVFASGHQAPETAYTKEYKTNEGIEGITRKSEMKKTNVVFCIAQRRTQDMYRLYRSKREREREGRKSDEL
jgi:hypothetical protein